MEKSNDKDKAIRIGFIILAVIALGYVFVGILKPSSEQAYNPQKAYQSEAITDEMFVPPPYVDPETKTTQETTDKQIEQWRADRSDLAAQWETADMANLAFRVGIAGIILLSWTLFETRSASRFAGETLRISNVALNDARTHARMELSPTVSISDTVISINDARRDNGGGIVGIKPVGNHIEEAQTAIFEGTLTANIKNWGVTPIYNFDIHGQVKLFNFEPVEHPKGPHMSTQPTEDGYIVGNVGMLAPGEEREIVCKLYIHHHVSSETLYASEAQGYYIPTENIFLSLEGKVSFWDMFTKGPIMDAAPRYQFFYYEHCRLGRVDKRFRLYPLAMFVDPEDELAENIQDGNG